MTIPIEQIITQYFKAWNDPTAEGTARWLNGACVPQVQYFDPRYTCRSADELAARIQRGRADFPSSRVEVTSAIDGYDDTFRYSWLFVFEPAKIRIPGVDVVVRAKDGRISALTSFFGTLESIEAGSSLRTQKPWSP